MQVIKWPKGCFALYQHAFVHTLTQKDSYICLAATDNIWRGLTLSGSRIAISYNHKMQRAKNEYSCHEPTQKLIQSARGVHKTTYTQNKKQASMFSADSVVST